MTIPKMISVIMAVASVWLGGSLGAVALEKANAAPLAGTASGSDPSTTSTPTRGFSGTT